MLCKNLQSKLNLYTHKHGICPYTFQRLIASVQIVFLWTFVQWLELDWVYLHSGLKWSVRLITLYIIILSFQLPEPLLTFRLYPELMKLAKVGSAGLLQFFIFLNGKRTSRAYTLISDDSFIKVNVLKRRVFWWIILHWNQDALCLIRSFCRQD